MSKKLFPRKTVDILGFEDFKPNKTPAPIINLLTVNRK